MAQSARKYEEFDQMDQVPIPAGGIATFLTAETGSWADEDDVMPRQGIAQVHQIADKLAEYGRNEDEYMIHAAEGETVIPMEVFDQNPTLRNKLFAEMRIMGIEPERYVVGNELNSINPVTGQPEFFLKKLFKGLKKIVKMVLPVIATIGLTILTGNPVLANAIVQGAQTAIQGGSLKDSLKSAAIGGIAAFAGGRIAGRAGWAANSAKQAMTSAAINTALHGGSTKDVLTGAALAGVVTKGVDFAGAKIADARTDPSIESIDLGPVPSVEKLTAAKVIDSAAPATPATPAPEVTLSQADFSTPTDQLRLDQATGRMFPEGTDIQAQYDADILRINAMPDATLSTPEINLSQADFDPNAALPPLPTKRYPSGEVYENAQVDTGAQVDPATLVSAPELPGAMDSFKDIFTGSGIKGEGFSSRLNALQDLFLPGIDRGQADTYLKNLKTNDPKAYAASFGNKTISDAYRQMSKDAFQGVGGFARKYGPAIGAGLGLMALAPKPKQPELMDISNMPSGQDLIDADPSKYRIYGDDYAYRAPNFTVQNVAGSAPYFQPTALAADGGIMNISDFPRRNGNINGPGTGTSDDIPAMLSDGEFVFTAQAVRGAGKGNREDGMKNMYQMMRQFEARA